jgi:hypothetical protein
MDSTPRNPFNPPLAEGVRRFGFRKWYERELLSSHAHLLLTILCALALVGTLEVFRGGSLSEKLLDVAMFIASGAIGLWSMRRYLYLLMHAEEVANQANCPDCGTYGRFTVMAEDPKSGSTGVCCRGCQGEWNIQA